MTSTGQRNPGGERQAPDRALDSREGDPRKRDQQDVRTQGQDRDREAAKDDPSRAPESGTP